MLNGKLDNEDRYSLRYFWQEKGDLERSSDWPELQAALLREHPDVWLAWQNYKLARLALGAAVDKLVEDD